LPGATLSAALPRISDLAVLSWDRGDPVELPAEAVEAVLDAARRAADLVVIDLPRYVDEAVRLAASIADVLLIVVPAEVRASAAAARLATQVSMLCHDVRVVVRGPAPSGLTGLDIARSLSLPLQGYLAAEPGLDRQLERGEPPGSRGGPLAELAEELLDDVLPAARRAA
jgi:secretion/DNA translocation related CpaE-like protein